MQFFFLIIQHHVIEQGLQHHRNTNSDSNTQPSIQDPSHRILILCEEETLSSRNDPESRNQLDKNHNDEEDEDCDDGDPDVENQTRDNVSEHNRKKQEERESTEEIKRKPNTAKFVVSSKKGVDDDGD